MSKSQQDFFGLRPEDEAELAKRALEAKLRREWDQAVAKREAERQKREAEEGKRAFAEAIEREGVHCYWYLMPDRKTVFISDYYFTDRPESVPYGKVTFYDYDDTNAVEPPINGERHSAAYVLRDGEYEFVARYRGHFSEYVADIASFESPTRRFTSFRYEIHHAELAKRLNWWDGCCTYGEWVDIYGDPLEQIGGASDE